MLSATFYAGSVLVPSQGWLIYGGLLDSDLTSAQKLVSLDDKWETGPDLYEGTPDISPCLVQVWQITILIILNGKNRSRTAESNIPFLQT